MELTLRLRVALAAVVLFLLPPVLSAQQSSDSDREAGEISRPRFGGPDSVDQQLASDAETERTLLDGFQDWKSGLAEDGLAFTVDYSAVWLSADQSPAEDEAASGMFRFYGSWDLVGGESGNTGSLIWKVENRHRYTDIPPGDFGLNLGYVGLTEPPFSNQETRLTNLYWRHRLNEGKVTVLGGWVDTTDYVDVYALASPWTGFANFVFSTGAATIGVPNEGLGAAVGAMVSDNAYLIAGFADTNSDPHDPGQGFDTFFDQREYFKHLEFGWTTAPDRIYLDNLHVTLWHTDERTEAGSPDGWGVNFSWTEYLRGKWLPFIRAGHANDGGTLLETSVSVGFGYQPAPGQNLLGVGLNYGEPNSDTFAPDLPEQTTIEVFYRFQFAREFAITPSLQYMKDPALNTDPDQDSIWVLGLRARLAL